MIAERRDQEIRDVCEKAKRARVSITEELAKLADLRSRGLLGEEEFKLAKRVILSVMIGV